MLDDEKVRNGEAAVEGRGGARGKRRWRWRLSVEVAIDDCLEEAVDDALAALLLSTALAPRERVRDESASRAEARIFEIREVGEKRERRLERENFDGRRICVFEFLSFLRKLSRGLDFYFYFFYYKPSTDDPSRQRRQRLAVLPLAPGARASLSSLADLAERERS